MRERYFKHVKIRAAFTKPIAFVKTYWENREVRKVTKILENLETKGLVTRKDPENPEDRTRWAISKTGQDILDEDRKNNKRKT